MNLWDPFKGDGNSGCRNAHGCGAHIAINITDTKTTDGHVNPVEYNLSKIEAGNLITTKKWEEIRNFINLENVRRSLVEFSDANMKSKGSVQDTGLSGIIEARDLNHLTDKINYWWTDGFVDASATVTASNVNYVIDKIIACGTECVCNCNYCTCNCNYCTCNCNYCTCDCNYNCSDKRFKTNIQKIGVQNGFNIYTFNYIWDKMTKHTGVMAQEVLKTSYKHAVKMDKNGYYMVDYSALPITIKGL